MDLLRTPEDRFADVPDWTYPPSYVTVDGVRIAYYYAGPPHSSVVLLLHGEPTWSYLYRSVIPRLIAAALQVGNIVNSACLTDLAPEIIAAYDAPFPDERFEAGARQFVRDHTRR